MGFKITWDKNQIICDINACAAQAKSPYNDGFSAWGCKKDLLDIQYHLQQELEKLPTFSTEAEYYQEREKQQVWKALNETTFK